MGQQSRLHGAPETAAQTHALLRAKAGFDIEQVVAEYRALRASVLRLWLDHAPHFGDDASDDLVRFNEAIDQAVAESVTYYTAEVDRWRHVFLGVLGHDLRGPLNAILLTAEVLSRMGTREPLSRHTVRSIQSGKRMKTLLDDLLDFSRASLGLGIGIRRVPSDLAQPCEDEVEVLRAALPHTPITFDAAGDTTGDFDVSRVREVLSNLVSNAAKYGTPGAAVSVRLSRNAESVNLSVENTGEPIPVEAVPQLFEPLRRGAPSSALGDRANLGLGLFIVREIARAHGGDISASSADGKTLFTMHLPDSPGASGTTPGISPSLQDR